MTGVTVVLEVYIKPRKIVTLEDFLNSESKNVLCDHCGRMVTDENRRQGVCQICSNKFTGRVFTCVNPECKTTIFFLEVVSLTIASCSQCNQLDTKHVLIKDYKNIPKGLIL